MIKTVLYDKPFPATVAAPYQGVSTAFRADISDQWDSVAFSTRVQGGYERLTMNINEDLDEMWRWYLERLGNHISVYDEYTDTMYEGIVWDIRLNWVGGNSYGISLGEMYNYVRVRYSQKIAGSVDRNHTPTNVGVTDADSIAIWGVKETIETPGDMEDTVATNYANTMIGERAWPEPKPNLSIPGMGSNPSLTVSCLGYWATLNYRMFFDTTEAVVMTNTQIMNLVDGTWNDAAINLWCSLLNPSNFYINGTNLNQTQHVENELTVQRRMLDLIEPGDTTFNRYFIGVWNDRILHIYPLPTHGRDGYTASGDRRSHQWYIDIGKGKLYDTMMAEWPVHRLKAGDMCTVLDVPLAKNQFIVGRTNFSTMNSTMTIQPYVGGRTSEQMLAQVALQE